MLEDGLHPLVLVSPHEYVVHIRGRIDQVDGTTAFLLDGLPEIVGEFGRDGIAQSSGWMNVVYQERWKEASGVAADRRLPPPWPTASEASVDTPSMPRESDPSERLIDAISRLTDYVEILGDILERFHVTCEWAVNNDRFRSVSENAP
jgi:hypothetical protein